MAASISQSVLALLDSLPNAENPVSALTELKTQLFAVHPSQLKAVVQNVSFNIIFDLLNSSNSEQISLCCDILTRLLGAMDTSLILEHFHQELILGLQHPALPVRTLVLKQLLQASQESQLNWQTDLIIKLVQRIGDDSLEAAMLAAKTLCHIGNQQETRTALYDGDVFKEMEAVMNSSTISKYRVYEMIIDLSCQSAENLNLAIAHGLLQKFLNELYTDDVLAQLNCLELLANLALSEHGLVYLEQQGIMGKLEDMLTNVESDPMMTFLLPGLIKFFSSVARNQPKEFCGRYPAFLSSVFDMLENGDESGQSIAVETLGFIGQTVEGKQVLDRHSNYMERSCRKLGGFLKNSQQPLKVKTLDSIANLVILKVADQTSEMLSLTESWFRHLGSNTLKDLEELGKQPFTDVKLGIMGLYAALAHQPWGQVLMNNHPGFKEYLLNRSTEKQKEGKEAKYDLIRTLADSPTSIEVFGRPFHMKLKFYVNEGPFFVQVQSEVAMESQ